MDLTGSLGANNELAFTELFASLHITDKFIRVAGATRINVKIVEGSGQVSDFNLPGGNIQESTLQQFEQTLFSVMDQHDIFVVAGSLPQAVTPQRYASWLDKTSGLQANPAKMDVASTVGAGDSLVAGLCWGELQNWDKRQSLIFATVLAALAVKQTAVGMKDIKPLQKTQQQVQIITA